MSKKHFYIRLIFPAIFFVGLFIPLAWHLYSLQIERYTDLSEKCIKKYTKSQKVFAGRGNIYDVDGHLLAANYEYYTIFVQPRNVLAIFKEKDDKKNSLEMCRKRADNSSAYKMLKKLFEKKFDLTEKQLQKRLFCTRVKTVDGKVITMPMGEVLLIKDVSWSQLEVLKTEICSWNKKTKDKNRKIKDKTKREHLVNISSWFRFEKTYKRYYPKHRLCANVLGFMGKDKAHNEMQAKYGIEKLYDEVLKPVNGEKEYEANGRGRKISVESKEIEKARPGADVYLTIDEQLQQFTEDELNSMVKRVKPKAAYALMADPKTGKILAMAQYPSFNPNDRRNIKMDAVINRVVSYVFEPGSIMKPIVVGSAISNGIITLNDTYFCENSAWRFAGKILHDCHRYGVLHVWEIIKFSSNIGTAKIAVEMGPVELFRTLRVFGFGRSTKVGLPNESRGIFANLNKWSKISVSRLPIGQGISVTPLQMVKAYCILANKGRLVQLHIVDKVVYADGTVVKNPNIVKVDKVPTLIKRPDFRDLPLIVTEKSTVEINKALKLVTQKGGTAPKAAIDGYEVAGKTGTAQKVIHGRYSHRKFASSFIGYVPADNPAFVLLVVVDEAPYKYRYGGTCAAPVFREIAKKTLKYMKIPPCNPSISQQGDIQ